MPPLLVLVVHQDDMARQRIISALAAPDMEIASCDTALSMFQELWAGAPDLLVLSDSLPGMDAFEICRQIRREQHLSGPAIMLFKSWQACTATEVVHALDAGADDYVSDVCNDDELAARARALIRRVQLPGSGQPAWRTTLLSPLWMASDVPRVQVGERTIWLTRTEHRLLTCLAEAHAVLPAAELHESVWDTPSDASGEALVRAHIRNLRKKIEEDPSRPVYIQTVHGIGYYLNNCVGDEVGYEMKGQNR